MVGNDRDDHRYRGSFRWSSRHGGVILEARRENRNLSVALLSGGVGGARMAQGLARAVAADRLTVIVNVGDDDDLYGVRVCPDLDTVVYTLAGVAGAHGWGIAEDTFTVMDHLDALGVDTTFRLGDRDLATSMMRTDLLGEGRPLSEVTAVIAERLGVRQRVLPATDGPLRTWIQTLDLTWLPFQEYFVMRGHEDEIRKVMFEGTMAATPGPGVVEAITDADLVVIAPSNPVLSIWPIIAVTAIRRAVEAHDAVVGISPLFGGKPLRGPADRALASQGLPPGNEGVLAAYEGLLTDLVVDTGDASDTALSHEVRIHVADTHVAEPGAATRFAEWLLETVGAAGASPG
jgi:LPPG:FO 2-phospho-L-lactate transferase